MTFKQGVFAVAMAALLAWSGAAGAQTRATVYKDADCGCCNGYIAYLRSHGIAPVAQNVKDVDLLKRVMRVPERLESCHTMVIDGYVVEGHVPIAAIERLLAERPEIIGISLPGMPMGSPGMNGEQEEPFDIYGFSKSGVAPFMKQ